MLMLLATRLSMRWRVVKVVEWSSASVHTREGRQLVGLDTKATHVQASILCVQLLKPFWLEVRTQQARPADTARLHSQFQTEP